MAVHCTKDNTVCGTLGDGETSRLTRWKYKRRLNILLHWRNRRTNRRPVWKNVVVEELKILQEKEQEEKTAKQLISDA